MLFDAQDRAHKISLNRVAPSTSSYVYQAACSGHKIGNWTLKLAQSFLWEALERTSFISSHFGLGKNMFPICEFKVLELVLRVEDNSNSLELMNSALPPFFGLRH